MTGNKARRLADVVDVRAPQGSNDARWFLLEHQIYEARIALQTARLQCELIGDHPENEEERELASAVLEWLTPVYVQMLEVLAQTLALLSGTEIAERMGRKSE
uniref:Uncharacterized protein n=1 Tax=viral metagenome TaxID=1070528 RepID=A0A6H2A1X8_9ZZZZ